MVTMILRAHSDWQQGMTVCMGVQECNTVAGFIGPHSIFKDHLPGM